MAIHLRGLESSEWYSSGVYYISQMLIDLIPTSIFAITVNTMNFKMTDQKNEAKRFWPFLANGLISNHLVESVSYFFTFAIPSTDLRLLCSFSLVISGTLFSGFVMLHEDMPDLFSKISNLTILKFILSPQLISVFGFDRCPANMTSKMLYAMGINDDDIYAEYTGYAIFQVVFYRFLSLIALLMTTNSRYYHQIVNYVKLKLFSRRDGMSPVNSTFKPECYENPVVIDIESVNTGTDSEGLGEVDLDSDSSSLYCSVAQLFGPSSVENVLELIDRDEIDHGLSIGWLELTLKVQKTFYSDEKLILRGIKGFIRFGALTALMGPSGAGKTSLLRSLNGMYKSLMTKESKIFLSNCHKIRTCFIAQDQKEHIVNGLSVYQTLLYASKLKNIGYNVDHEMNIKKLMDELLIFDIKGKTAHKCSVGQQKRIVMAMELTANIKPNLICVDEPTSGVDSYSALLMIKCFKTISKTHSLSIITSIHQPSLEILMLYDMLYVLAKGGVTVFSGRPQRLRRHLNECQIYLEENQIPIEVLLKIGARGCDDETVLKLSEKTNQFLEQYESTMLKELKYFPNGIATKNKKFSIDELYHLFMRTIVCTIRYDCVLIIGFLLIELSTAGILRIMFADQDLEMGDNCVSTLTNTTDGCLRTEEQLESTKLARYNEIYMSSAVSFSIFLSLFTASIAYKGEVKTFMMENRNQWYSCESFFLVKTVLEHILLVPIIMAYTAIVVINKYDTDNIYIRMFFATYTNSSLGKGVGACLGICLDKNLTAGLLLVVVYHLIYIDMFVPNYEFDQSVQSFNLLTPKYNLEYILSWFYQDKCQGDQISSLLYKYKIEPKVDLHKYCILMILAAVMVWLMAYFFIKIKINYDTIMIKFNELADKVRKVI